MTLQFHYPRSFASLLLVGFGLVALPLIGGMLNAGYMLDKIVREGRRSVAVTAEVTQATGQLAEATVALERAAGQFYVLKDPALQRVLTEAHRRFSAAVSALRAVPMDRGQVRRLDEVAAQESELFARLGTEQPAGAEKFEAFKPRFDGLYAAVSAMTDEGRRLIDGQVAAMGKTADAVQRALLWQALAMIPLSLFLAGLFSWLINRPVGQLAQAIRQLGENHLQPANPINGPRDLAYLGEQLDWLRRRLLDLEEQKLRFLRQVSHELKTPLTALREGVELLADRVAGDLTAQQEEIARIMRNNSRELQRRIDDLLRYNQVVGQPETLASTTVGLNELLLGVLRRHRLSLQSKGLRLAAAFGGLELWGDRGKLRTVLDNLLANAIRFSPRGGTIEIAAKVVDGRAQLTVCDQGPGVPPEDRPHIFEPFYQGAIQPGGGVRGTGLGLAIVKEYVEAHGGQVTLLDSPGWGACFEIVLPLREAAKNAS
jgi:two-component system sensor histidine kinase GlrK